uniref:Molybdenum cofactor sulfurase n=1 Tax=Trepomonas sp. PC1 TaxID=1076344 RepID=A0A146K4P9_9EUKA|eukprot:JAP91862.1 Molybdenum cofactor sulfurase [Trepomonas sp. PC1]
MQSEEIKNKSRASMLRKFVLVFSAILAFLSFNMLIGKTTPEDQIPKKYHDFLKAHPKYGYNGTIYKMRREQFPHFPSNETYLDYTGAGVYQKKQLDSVFNRMQTQFKCNTHSTSSCSQNTEDAIEEVRNRITDFFNAPRGAYSVIFTQSATAALHLVGDTFPFSNQSKWLYSKINHNSVLGIRELAKARGASYQTLEWDIFNKEIINKRQENCKTIIRKNMLVDESAHVHNLVAFPAEDNLSGTKFPLDLVNAFEQNDFGQQYNPGRWHVLLDAAAFIPTNPLDLSKYPASFVVMSFYKLFGWPTGIGALLIRNDLGTMLKKPYFAGGSVVVVGVDNDFVQLKAKYNEKFEDGTLDFHSIDHLRYGFDAIEELGVENIQSHVWAVTRRFYERLSQMKHKTGKKLAVIYGQHHLNDSTKQGGIIIFNLKDVEDKYIRFSEVTQRTIDAGFMIRAGSSCNPGSINNFLGLNEIMVRKINEKRTACADEIDNINGYPIGAIRVSIGYPTTLEEVDALADFIEKEYVNYNGRPYAKLLSTMGLFQE